ncbi:MAG: 3-deoxy-D-manno-octulosonic acid transferase [Dysgonamonadaceae bacterium]|nr:3-deoxy-D-manno-octulosonic acid transferase [Dysgonamonadaceae bacterium]
MIYNLAIGVYALIARLISPFHKKAGLMIRGQKQTFKRLQEQIDPQSQYIWIHAASLGEFEQGRPLIEKIKADYPEYKILLTFFSPSGYEVRKNSSGTDLVCYLPFDFSHNAQRFLNLTNPVMAIFIKYEFWMNYLCSLHKRRIPTYIISAIFRPKQAFFKWYGTVYRSVLKHFDWLFVQDDSSLHLLADYGITNASVSGDTRFDRVMEIYNHRKSFPLLERYSEEQTNPRNRILVAGSTWPKDEELIIPYFNTHPEIKLIIAPHEINDTHLESIISRLKRPFILYSNIAEKTEPLDADCIIVDCYGILSSIYRYANIAYVGGGFGCGIHNILEAAVYNIPVLFGPNHRKFREASDLMACEGGFSVENGDFFEMKMNELLSQREAFLTAGKQAGDYVRRNVGATELIMKKIFDHA